MAKQHDPDIEVAFSGKDADKLTKLIADQPLKKSPTVVLTQYEVVQTGHTTHAYTLPSPGGKVQPLPVSSDGKNIVVDSQGQPIHDKNGTPIIVDKDGKPTLDGKPIVLGPDLKPVYDANGKAVEHTPGKDKVLVEPRGQVLELEERLRIAEEKLVELMHMASNDSIMAHAW